MTPQPDYRTLLLARLQFAKLQLEHLQSGAYDSADATPSQLVSEIAESQAEIAQIETWLTLLDEGKPLPAEAPNYLLELDQKTPLTDGGLGGARINADGDVNIQGDVVGRDKIVNNISKTVNNVFHAVDDALFKRIGLEQRLGFIILGTLIVGGIAGIYLMLRPDYPDQMPESSFNIAIAAFNESGDAEPVLSGFGIADGIYRQLAAELPALDLGLANRPITTVWAPEDVARVGEIDPVCASTTSFNAALTESCRQERANAAGSLAHQINADILVYGLVESAGNNVQIAPEFYVRESNFYQAAEIAGQNQIGSVIRVLSANSVAQKNQLNATLSARTEILTHLVYGLSYMFIGEYESALTIYQNAENSDWQEREEGLPLLYLLMGNVYLRLAAESPTDEAILEQAVSYYEQSVELDQEHARAYLGVGSGAHLQAVLAGSGGNGEQAFALLNESEAAFLDALSAENQPPSADIPAKVDFGIGQIYFTRYFLMPDGERQNKLLEQSERAYSAVTTAWGDGANPRLVERAAESYARLGRIYWTWGEDAGINQPQIWLPAARDAYAKAVELFNDPNHPVMYESGKREHYQERVDALNELIDAGNQE